jgi:hypothetical protein
MTTSESGERFCEPVVDMYLERVIIDYPSPHATLADDWPDLKRCLEQHHDAEGLNDLGSAFRERLLGPQRSNKQYAVDCFQAALRIYTREQAPAGWAMTQNNLEIAVRAQIAIAEIEK